MSNNQDDPYDQSYGQQSNDGGYYTQAETQDTTPVDTSASMSSGDGHHGSHQQDTTQNAGYDPNSQSTQVPQYSHVRGTMGPPPVPTEQSTYANYPQYSEHTAGQAFSSGFEGGYPRSHQGITYDASQGMPPSQQASSAVPDTQVEFGGFQSSKRKKTHWKPKTAEGKQKLREKNRLAQAQDRANKKTRMEVLEEQNRAVLKKVESSRAQLWYTEDKRDVERDKYTDLKALYPASREDPFPEEWLHKEAYRQMRAGMSEEVPQDDELEQNWNPDFEGPY